MMDTWDLARGADGNKRLMGSGYGCYVEDRTGATDMICMPNTTTPVPAPTPPPPAPTPPPSVPCSSLTVVIQSSSCNSRMKPADTETMTRCAATICSKMDSWDMARGADGTKSLVGVGYGCIVEDGSGAGDMICMPNNTTPVPAPTPPPPARTQPPSVPCSSLSIVIQSSSCNLGWIPADTETMTRCAATICSKMDSWDMARGADDTKRLVGVGYGCIVEDGSGAGDMICMPNNTTPVPAPTPPPPAPTPPPSVPCSSLTVVIQSSSCNSRMKPADTETMTRCAATICSKMDSWDMARGADGTKSLVGVGYGCIVEDGSGAGDMICMPNNTTPVPAPTPPPPARTQPPSVPCSSLSIVIQSSSCNLGWIPADTETMTRCAATICSKMDSWDMARGADDTKRLVGVGYGCIVEDGSGAGDMICMPNNTTPVPAPTPPPSVPCSSLTVVIQSSSCNSRMKPADTETMTRCAATICSKMDSWDMARGADGTKRLVGVGYGCIVEDGSGAGDMICMPNNTTPVPAPTPPPPARTPPPSVPCSSLSIVIQSSSCNLGWIPADTETMTRCAATICSKMDSWDMARGADGTKRLVGVGYGCIVEDGSGVGDMICMPNYLISK